MPQVSFFKPGASFTGHADDVAEFATFRHPTRTRVAEGAGWDTECAR
jgi:hypothetical protein